MSASGWAVPAVGDCEPRPNSSAVVALCSATGEVDGYAVTVSQLGGSRDDAAVLTLDVRPLG